MQGVLDYLFGTASFVPYGYCLLWRPDLVAMHAIADAMIAFAYFSIPVALIVFVRRRRDLQYRWVFALFATFIMACGTTHLVALIALWEPIYGLQGLIKAGTGLISIATAATLWPLLPKALALPGPGELESINDRLSRGIEERLIAQQRLQFAYQQIEERIALRTRELAEVNERLRAEIEVRERAEEQQEMLLAELRHRVRNTLAIVKSIAAQTRHHSDSMDGFSRAFNARVQALSDTHTLLFDANWTRSTLAELIRRHLKPYGGDRQARLDGPEVLVRPKAALSLSLVLHELAANAAKYGGLSRPEGEVEVTWRILQEPEQAQLELTWRERGGPEVRPPARRGFGSEVIDFTIALEFQGEVRTEFAPEGLVARFTLPLANGGL